VRWTPSVGQDWGEIERESCCSWLGYRWPARRPSPSLSFVQVMGSRCSGTFRPVSS